MEQVTERLTRRGLFEAQQPHMPSSGQRTQESHGSAFGRVVTGCTRGARNVISTLISPLFVKKINAQGRTVRLYRHIPLLGTVDYLLRGTIARHFLPPAEKRTFTTKHEVVLCTPNSQTCSLKFRSGQGWYKAVGGMKAQRTEGSRQVKRLPSLLVRTLGMASICTAAVCNIASIPAPLAVLLAAGSASVFRQTASAMLQLASFLLTPRPFGMSIETQCDTTHANGTVVSPSRQNGVIFQALLLESASSSFSATPITKNCAEVAAGLLQCSSPDQTKKHLAEPLVFWTPLNTLMQAHNINTLNSAYGC